jgi:hypothetical protein
VCIQVLCLYLSWLVCVEFLKKLCCVLVFYICWIVTLYPRDMICKYSLPFCALHFYLVFDAQKFLIFLKSNLFFSFCLVACLWCYIEKKIIAKFNVMEFCVVILLLAIELRASCSFSDLSHAPSPFCLYFVFDIRST